MSRIDVIWRKSLAPFWKNIRPKEISQGLVIEFINWHKKARPNIQLVNVFKYLGNIFQVMVEAGALELAKKPRLELPKTEQLHHSKQKGRYITDEEFNQILSKTSGWFKLFLLIAYTTGMRKMEIGKMELARMEKIGERWIFSLNTDNTKTGNARKIPLAKMLTPLVDEQIKKNEKYLFEFSGHHVKPQSIDQKWQRAKRDAQIIGRMREHDLRHSAASNMAKAGINPVMATTLLGMSLQMFQKTYLKLTPDDLVIASESAVGRLRGGK
jgi:integrase